MDVVGDGFGGATLEVVDVDGLSFGRAGISEARFCCGALEEATEPLPFVVDVIRWLLNVGGSERPFVEDGSVR